MDYEISKVKIDDPKAGKILERGLRRIQALKTAEDYLLYVHILYRKFQQCRATVLQ